MEPNQDTKIGQPVENKANQPIVPAVKKEETNANNPAINQDRQPVSPKENEQQPETTSTDAKKITDVPDTKEHGEEVVKGEATGNFAPEKK